MGIPDINTGILMGVFSGMLLGSFALPLKKIKIWQWEHTWIMYSLWGTVILPFVFALITVPKLFRVFSNTPVTVILIVFLFGAGWGIGNITYGIGLKIVGLALGTSIVLGLNNAIGALLPIILYNRDQFLQPVGLTITAGVIVMIVGIIVCAKAGIKREIALNINLKEKDKNNLAFKKGLIICFLAGIFGAMFNFALINGKPMEQLAISFGATRINAANPTWIIALGGGFIVTLIYCLFLFGTNKNFKLFTATNTGINWIFTVAMGLMWYIGVAIYGMAVSKLGNLGASIGWPIIQSMAVISGNFWGIITGEWKGSGVLPLRIMIYGLVFLLLGIVLVGIAASL